MPGFQMACRSILVETFARKARLALGTPDLNAFCEPAVIRPRSTVAILDDDDRWEPGHLESCLALAQRDDLDLVAATFPAYRGG